jgi:peroxiredoxin
MIRKFFYLILLSLAVYSCSSRSGEFTVEGTLENADGKTVYLKELTTNKGLLPVDSAQPGEKGRFKLHGITDMPRFYSLNISSANYITLLIKPGDEIEITADASDLQHGYKVKGSNESELIRRVVEKQNEAIERINNLGQIYRDSVNSPDILEIKARLDSTYRQIVAEQKEFTTGFISDHPASFASLMALYQRIAPRSYVLNPQTDFKYFSMVDSNLVALYPEAEAVKSLHDYVTDVREQMNNQSKIEKSLEIGSVAPEISLPDPHGDTISLSSLRGKYVLLDFWASWCSPCRHENPNLVANYKKYHDKGFEIFQVSLDKSKESWEKAIQDDHLDWYHVSDLNYWNSVVVPLYNIQGIPANFLLDKDGKIIAKNLNLT